jgi:hypothetical protein
MKDGPTEDVRLRVYEGLLKTMDLGIVSHQIRARICQALFYDALEDNNLASFHHDKAQALVRQHDLARWYELLNRVLKKRAKALV